MRSVNKYSYVISMIWTDYFGQLGVGYMRIGIKETAILFSKNTTRPSGNIETFAIELANHIGTTKL